MSLALDILTHINLDDLASSFGWQDRRYLNLLIHRIFRGAARKFAGQMLAFDAMVGRHGNLIAASRLILQRNYIRGLNADGLEHVPRRGPVLFLANHPGLVDAISLFATIGRADLKVIGLRRPFLESLANTAKHIFFVDDNLGNRVIAADAVGANLRGGGAVLTFPAGRIEPDPDLYPDALDSVGGWADSARLVARLAPEAVIVPVLVRGVIWENTARHWLARLKPTGAEREKFIAALQLLAMVSRNARPTTVNVSFAAPILLAECKPEQIRHLVAERMRQLLVRARVGAPAPPSATPAVTHVGSGSRQTTLSPI